MTRAVGSQIGRTVRSAADAQRFQRELYDREIAEHGHEAYVEGALGRRLLAERIATASRYIAAGGRVLDVGCGDGSVSAALCNRGATVVGIDVSASAIRLAQGRNPHPNARYIQATIEDYREDRPFDLVTAFEVLEHVHDPMAFFDRVAAMLRPGGHFALSTPNRRSLEWWIAYALRRLRRADLEPLFRTDERHVRELDYIEVLDFGFRAGLEPVEARGVILLNRIAEHRWAGRWAREIMVRAAHPIPELAKDQYVVFKRCR